MYKQEKKAKEKKFSPKLTRIEKLTRGLLSGDNKDSLFTVKDGRGVFLKASIIRKDSFVMEYSGDIISGVEADARITMYDSNSENSSILYFIFQGTHMAIDATRKRESCARFLSHSQNPNICFHQPFIIDLNSGLPRIAAYALRDIHEGEEIVVDCGIQNDKYKVDSGSSDSQQVFQMFLKKSIVRSMCSDHTGLSKRKAGIKKKNPEIKAFSFKNLVPKGHKNAYFASYQTLGEPEKIKQLSEDSWKAKLLLERIFKEDMISHYKDDACQTDRIILSIEQDNKLGATSMGLQSSVKLLDINKCVATKNPTGPNRKTRSSSLFGVISFSLESTTQRPLSKLSSGIRERSQINSCDTFVAKEHMRKREMSLNRVSENSFIKENCKKMKLASSKCEVVVSGMLTRNLDHEPLEHCSSSLKAQVAVIKPYVTRILRPVVELSDLKNVTDLTANDGTQKQDNKLGATSMGLQSSVKLLDINKCVATKNPTGPNRKTRSSSLFGVISFSLESTTQRPLSKLSSGIRERSQINSCDTFVAKEHMRKREMSLNRVSENSFIKENCKKMKLASSKCEVVVSGMLTRNLDHEPLEHCSSSLKAQVAVIKPYVTRILRPVVELSDLKNVTDLTANDGTQKASCTLTDLEQEQLRALFDHHIVARQVSTNNIKQVIFSNKDFFIVLFKRGISIDQIRSFLRKLFATSRVVYFEN